MGLTPLRAAVVFAGLQVRDSASCAEVVMVASVPLMPFALIENEVQASIDIPSRSLPSHPESVPRVQRCVGVKPIYPDVPLFIGQFMFVRLPVRDSLKGTSIVLMIRSKRDSLEAESVVMLRVRLSVTKPSTGTRQDPELD